MESLIGALITILTSNSSKFRAIILEKRLCDQIWKTTNSGRIGFAHSSPFMKGKVSWGLNPSDNPPLTLPL